MVIMLCKLGLSEQKESRSNKASLGHFKKANSTPLKKLVEFMQILVMLH